MLTKRARTSAVVRGGRIQEGIKQVKPCTRLLNEWISRFFGNVGRIAVTLTALGMGHATSATTLSIDAFDDDQMATSADGISTIQYQSADLLGARSLITGSGGPGGSVSVAGGDITVTNATVPAGGVGQNIQYQFESAPGVPTAVDFSSYDRFLIDVTSVTGDISIDVGTFLGISNFTAGPQSVTSPGTFEFFFSDFDQSLPSTTPLSNLEIIVSSSGSVGGSVTFDSFRAASAAQAGQTFVIEKVLDTDDLVPGGGGQTFTTVDEPPHLSNGTIFGPLRFSSPSIEGMYTASVGGPIVEIIKEGDPMPDGNGTVVDMASIGFSISGDNLVYTVDRSSTNLEVTFIENSGSAVIIVEESVTMLPGGSGNVFTSTSNSDPFPIDGSDVVFEGAVSGVTRGIYGWFDNALTAIAEQGDPSPDGSTYSGNRFDEPSIDDRNVAFEANTNDGAVQGAFGVFEGSPFVAVTTNTNVPGQADTFTFLDNPQISGPYIVVNGDSASVDEGIYRIRISPTVLGPEKIVEIGDNVPDQPGQIFTDIGEEGLSMDGTFAVFEGGFGVEEGMYAWVDGTLHRIFDTTQPLDGKDANAVDFEGEGLDGNQLAFKVVFTDGSQGAFLATLVSDTDNDGVADNTDNCTEFANPGQEDSNGDLIGNACDPDVAGPNGLGDDDCSVNFVDLGAFKAGFFGTEPVLDLTGPAGAPDGIVNFSDLERVKALFFGPPGPSAGGCN